MAVRITDEERQHDQRVLDIVLRRIGFDRAILTSSRTYHNTLVKGRIVALLRTAITPQCAQMTWQRIALAMGSQCHSKMMYLNKRHIAVWGEVSFWQAINADGTEFAVPATRTQELRNAKA